jgi:hypothetical protein
MRFAATAPLGVRHLHFLDAAGMQGGQVRALG